MPQGGERSHNIAVWAPWCGVDTTYSAPDAAAMSAGLKRIDLVRKLGGVAEDPLVAEAVRVLEEVQATGVLADRPLQLPHEVLREVNGWLEKLRWRVTTHIGGNPAISSERHAYLARGCADKGLPDVVYVGVLPEVVEHEYLGKLPPDDRRLLEDRFQVFPSTTPYWTVAIAGTTTKLMMQCKRTNHVSPLLEVADKPPTPKKPAAKRTRKRGGKSGQGTAAAAAPAPAPTFHEFAERVFNVCAGYPGTKVLALGSTKSGSPEEWGALVRDVKDRFERTGGGIRIFISTSGFRVDSETRLEDPNAEALFKQVFRHADVISMSSDELEVMYRAVLGPDPDKPVAQKLRELDLQALKVCHSPSGAILDVSRVPDELITHQEYRSDPGGKFLNNCVQWACDGTTAALDDPAARKANFSQVRAYSANTASRQEESSFVDFVHPSPLRQLPPGIIRVAAPYVNWRRGSLVGLGAIFDSLLLAFLLRHDHATPV